MLLPWSTFTNHQFTNLSPVVTGFLESGWVVERVPSSSHNRPKTTGVYLLFHFLSGRAYVGSHADLYARPYQHHSLLAKEKHWCRDFQEAFDIDKGILPMFIVTRDREEAYDLEQKILDRFLSTGLLFNTAKNARLAMKDLEVSEETRSKLGTAARGKTQSPEWIEKRISSLRGVPLAPERVEKIRQKALSRGVSPELTKAAAAANSKPVLVDGVVFASVTDTANHFNLAPSSVKKRIASKNPLFSSWSYPPSL